MALLGIDIGDQSCFVGAAIGGGIEVITNDVSDRLTPMIVSFRSQDRKIGASAKSQLIINYKNTIFGIKNLLGRDFSDPIVQDQINKLPFTVGSYPNSNQVGILVNYLGSDRWFTPTQIYSMLLRHIADNAEKTLHTKILSTVISVPGHYTDIQRRAIFDAANIAGVPSQRLLNDGNAIALAYGIYKKDLPEEDQSPRNIAFVDMGRTSFQVNIFAFSSGKANCLSSVSIPNLGGRDFDQRLFDHFSTQFNLKYKVNIFQSKKSCLKLLAECETLKKLLSTNSSSIPMNIECLMDDLDYSFRMNRNEFNTLCDEMFLRVESALQEALTLSKLGTNDLFSVELVGGSSRIPAIATIIQKIFCKEVSKTLNFDESVAKGCAIQCALLSPTIRVRQFHVVGVIPYAIRINWVDPDTGDKGEMNAFKVGTPSNLSKVLSFYRRSDFRIECSYKHSDITAHVNPLISIFTVKNVKPTEDGQLSKVKVKFRVDNSGILTIPNVELVEKKVVEVKAEESSKVKSSPASNISNTTQVNDKVEMEGASDNLDACDEIPDPDVNMSESDTIKSNPTDSAESMGSLVDTCIQREPSPSDTDNKVELQEQETTEPKKFKELIVSILLPVTVDARNMSQIDIDKAIETEGNLIAQDRYQAEKAISKNSLEEYVYDLRDKLENNLNDYFQDDEKNHLIADLENINNWLIDDDTQEEPSVYKDKLKCLQTQGDPGILRYREFQERPDAFNILGQSLVRYRKFVSEYRGGKEEYCHLDVEEVHKVEKMVDEKQRWLEEQLLAHQKLAKHENPTFTAADIRSTEKHLVDFSLPIISKPKPKPKEEPPKDIPKPSEKSEKLDNLPTQATDGVHPINTQEDVHSEGNIELLPNQQQMDLD
ncbi:Heat shock 70 kDa protein 4-like [Oopsacas minuta]|uniref:Heat shock 70 kDa protein 4-like n=1 Tax=Oopsacas minuta TaxID=111878 RepID=A0AAV7JBF1_9METZ|nr:Heat shock 70 kDa protein 4-like [Oopsacas minuta]